ncbi:MAG: universal stress protein [Acidobacteria bacterium]|nr:universal stress protein [Acidobacteriota bacterium]
MSVISKILIAYDGSACSDAALNDLTRAGLPSALEAVVVTVADVILPPPDDEMPADDQPAIRIPEVERHAQARAEKAIKEVRAFAERAAKRVKADFPGWDVRAEAQCDSPAWAVIKMAADLDYPGLIVVGSHRHSVLGGRLILGSVSQRVLYEARCSVRVARCSDERREGPVRIVIGFNGSPDSELALDAVKSRAWPEGSEARIVTALETQTPVSPDGPAEELRAAGLLASRVAREGDPRHILLEEAEKWDADSIFIGTKDIHGFQHLLHGSVSAAVAARASCSVEVVRPEGGVARIQI